MNNNIISIDNSFVSNIIYNRKIFKFFQKQNFYGKNFILFIVFLTLYSSNIWL